MRDTRPFHKAIFRSAVPPACTYLSGQYRGSDFGCLKYRMVGMADRVGARPEDVDSKMADFNAVLTTRVNGLVHQVGSATDTVDGMAWVASAIAQAVSSFQDIHPYADGNGHIGRLLVWVMMGQLGLCPRQLPIHTNPGWDEAVRQHQQGWPSELERFVLLKVF